MMLVGLEPQRSETAEGHKQKAAYFGAGGVEAIPYLLCHFPNREPRGDIFHNCQKSVWIREVS